MVIYSSQPFIGYNNNDQNCIVRVLHTYNDQINIINNKAFWAKKELIYLRTVYHYIHNKYWLLSIIIILLSSLLTIIESIKLIFIDSKNKYSEIKNSTSYEYNENRLISSISKHNLDWNLSCDLLSLFTGGIITLIMSLIRFNKYQVKLELISNRLLQITNYETSINQLKYKIENNINIPDINNEIITLDENISTNSEMKKLLSENKERDLRFLAERIITHGPEYNVCYYKLRDIICCIRRRDDYNDEDDEDFKNKKNFTIGATLVNKN